VTFDEHKLPCLYLLWPRHLSLGPPRAEIPGGYVSRPYVEGDDVALRQLLGREGWGMADDEWQGYKDKILPGGLFLLLHADTRILVATAGAAHNPNPGRYYFPFGGELGYLLVHPEHRGKRLGQAVSAMVVERFMSAGYESIRVCVQGFRLAAIKTYLRLGFVPFLHAEDASLRWQRICERIGRPFEPEKWPRPPHDTGMKPTAA
jgi:mycothiol synthase